MISVLVPSHARPGGLCESIRSLFSIASDQADVEVLVRQDDGDLDYAVVEPWEWQQIKRFRGPRHGYTNLHRYYNELAAMSDGDYLLLWNDDARMITPGWDTLIRQHDPHVPFVATPDGRDHPFPVISRALYQTLGHFSRAAHCDHWVCEIGKAAGCMVALGNIKIAHLRDELDDETKREGVEAQEKVTLPALAMPETRALLAADIAKVTAAIGAAA